MARHFVSITRGLEGSKYADFTYATSSSATAAFEFSVVDGVTPSRVEVIKALEAFIRVFENPQQVVAGAFDVSG